MRARCVLQLVILVAVVAGRVASASVAAVCGAGDSGADCAALQAVHTSLVVAHNGSRVGGWLTGSTFCGWPGVTCANASSASSAERRVEQLRLAGQDLVGTLPAKLAELTRLKLLDLGENMLEGPVPLELGKMASLESLDLHQNNLNGTVPESLRDLKNLQFLELSHNTKASCFPP